MDECERCGTEATKVKLYDIISKKGIIKICENCLKEDSSPRVKKPNTFQLKEAEQSSSVYERLSSIAGLNAKEHLKKFRESEIKKKESLKNQETTLRDLVDKNYKKEVIDGKKIVLSNDKLISNFHWIVMRARRMKKLTQAQIAREIGEAEAAIKMAEQGILPDDSTGFVKKLEAFLGIRIIKPEFREQKPKQLSFDKTTTKEITLKDIKNIKAEQETKSISNEIEEDFSLNKDFKLKLDKLLREQEKNGKN